MAHDQGMFSARRPRETLASVQNLTGIPQPASAIKRTSSVAQFQNPAFSSQNARASIRQSMSRPPQPSFGRMSMSANANNLGAGAGVDGGLSSVRRSVAGNMLHGGAGHAAAPRHSMAPPPMPMPVPANKEALQRRSSVLSRPSIALAPMGSQSFFTQTPMAPGVPRDPRPLRDRSFQARISQELLEYLAHNNFELEMKHSLTQNTLKSPTQKDFTYIFQWLYHRIDPSYKFIKSMDAEVPPILKQLRYPYAGHITKSQITAVGGQNWSTFLGMLHWMMQLAQMLDKYSVGTYDDACAEAGVDITGDRIIFNFLTGAYRDWLQAGEDEDDESAQQRLVPHIEAMAAEFEKVNEKYVQEAQALEAENRNLRNQLEELEKNAPDMNKLERHFKILEEDKKKFEDYNENVQSKIHKYEHRVKFFDDEIAKTEAELQAAEEEQSGLQESVDRQGITIQDIDRMNTEQERLQKSLDDMLTKLQEAHTRMMERENEANQRLETLEELVKSYNTMGYQSGVIPPTAANAKGVDYELVLALNENTFSSSHIGGGPPTQEGDRLLADATTGYTPRNLINLDLRGVVRSNFIALRKEINERRKVALDADMNHRDLLDNIKEAMDEKRSEVEALEHKRRAAEEEFEKIKEITTTQKLASDAQIEKMEKELAKMRSTLTESIQLMEQREMNTNIEYEQLVVRANALREELHTGVESMLNDVIRFKVHVQKSLEDYESFVADQVEAELGEDDDLVEDGEGDVVAAEEEGGDEGGVSV